MNKIKLVTSLLLVSAGLVACNGGPNQPNIELLQDMMDQRALKSQKYDEIRDMPSAMVPPENTVPRGFNPYPYAGDALKAEANLKNPLVGEAAEKMAARGEDRFKIYCSPCHGMQGKGDGTVAQFMPLKPPPLISDKVRNYKDGRIFHIITDGQGLMQTYATQVRNEEDRWAIVNYVRKLQAQAAK
jgi:mono/diheme cytochrome c family protein